MHYRVRYLLDFDLKICSGQVSWQFVIIESWLEMTIAMMKQILLIGIMMEVTFVEVALTKKNLQSVSVMKKLYQ